MKPMLNATGDKILGFGLSKGDESNGGIFFLE